MGRMVQIDDFIKELQETRRKFGNTCVYIRDVSWGAVALNREAEDEAAEQKRAADAMWLCPCGRKHKESANTCKSCGYVRC
jgi:hypothetical protein